MCCEEREGPRVKECGITATSQFFGAMGFTLPVPFPPETTVNGGAGWIGGLAGRSGLGAARGPPSATTVVRTLRPPTPRTPAQRFNRPNRSTHPYLTHTGEEGKLPLDSGVERVASSLNLYLLL